MYFNAYYCVINLICLLVANCYFCLLSYTINLLEKYNLKYPLFMKKIILVCALLSFVFTAQSQSQKDVILTIENIPVYKQEFLRVYKKNLDLVKDASQKSVDGYLELFVDYKLKVQEAYAQKLDQGKAYKKEFEKYRIPF